MMNSIILQAAARLLTGLIFLVSVYTLMRGHDEAGGGFIGALIASAGFALYNFAYGPAMLRRSLPINPVIICIVGLAAAVLSGLPAIIRGDPFLTGIWYEAYAAGRSDWPITTILLFDIGVYFVVIGGVLALLLALEEDIEK